jgi:hypothetical protein
MVFADPAGILAEQALDRLTGHGLKIRVIVQKETAPALVKGDAAGAV